MEKVETIITAELSIIYLSSPKTTIIFFTQNYNHFSSKTSMGTIQPNKH